MDCEGRIKCMVWWVGCVGDEGTEERKEVG